MTTLPGSCRFEPGRSITVDAPTTLFGYVAVTYRAVPVDDERSRLVAKLAVAARRGCRLRGPWIVCCRRVTS
jgi:hypothetical protein